jgi:hypothetical protein
MNQIRNFQNSDQENIQNFLAELKVNSDSGYAIFGTRENPFLKTIVLEQGGKFGGFGSVWKKNLHDKPLYISTYVREDEQCLENLEMLYKNFKEAREKDFSGSKFQTAYPSHLKKHLDFYFGKNFKKVLETYSKTIPVSKLNLNTVLEKSADLEIKSFAESEFFKNRKDSILTMLIENYKLGHLHNPPKEESLEFWDGHYLGEDFLLDYSYLLIKENVVVGILLARKIDDTIIFFEIVVLNVDAEKVHLIVNILLTDFLGKLKIKNEFKNVEFELDVNAMNLEIINQLGLESVFEDSDKIVTLQEI